MSNVLILDPIDLASGWITASHEVAGFPATNVIHNQPLVVWKASSGAAYDLTIDLQVDTPIDTVYLGYTNAAAGTTWQIVGATAAQGTAYLTNPAAVMMATATLRASEALGPYYHAFWTGTSKTVRYLRLIVTHSGEFSAGLLLLGAAWRPTWNFEWEAGRGVVDTSLKERLRGGNLDIDERGIVAEWTMVLGDLTDAEARALWKIKKQHGESRPLLLCEDPDSVVAGLNERLHYGVFKELTRYGRTAPDKVRWEMTFEDWL